jgi:protein-tyrosine phosphatase
LDGASPSNALIDLHTHILPGVDDGAESMADSLDMARVAVADGITLVVATPHRHHLAYHAPREDAQNRLEELRAALDEAGIPLQVRLGGEAQIAPDSAEQFKSGLALTINESRYLLLEWPFEHWPLYSDQAVFALQLLGIVPIMAHAERYRIVQRNHQQLDSLIERGLIIQINASSLTGSSGGEAKRTAERLITTGAAHLLASDAHSARSRSPILSLGRDRAAELVGLDRARAMVEDVPQQIVANRPIDLPAPAVRPPRPFWAIWRSNQ